MPLAGMRLTGALLTSAFWTTPSLAQPPCPTGRLPAYSHNDYERREPLAGALALGFRGVEADVVLIGSTLRVGHDRSQARRGPSLESTYLAPLRELAARCGRLTSEGGPFLLTLELKEPHRAAFDSLAALLVRYDDLLAPSVGEPGPSAVQVVLVGWHPPLAEWSAAHELPPAVGVQRLLANLRSARSMADTTRIRLVSVNYGKTIARRWRRDASLGDWLRALAVLRQAYPAARIRVFNIPADGRIYEQLLKAGVDTEDPARTAAVLERLVRQVGALKTDQATVAP